MAEVDRSGEVLGLTSAEEGHVITAPSERLQGAGDRFYVARHIRPDL
jgi:hypothetical protein